MRPHPGPGPGLDLNLNQILDPTLDMNQHKSTLQNLNSRLSSYIHQVWRLELSNQALEQQIEAELQLRLPGDLKHLELKTASDLQDQISELVAECARLKLQSLGAELSVFDVKSRCEEVGAEREQLEAELRDLKLLWVELQEHHLTDLNQEVFEKEAELQQLQTQHQQDVRCFGAQSAQISVLVQNQTPDPDLTLQLQNMSWSCIRLPEVTWSRSLHQEEACVPEEAELLQLKTTASSLKRELDQVQQETCALERAALDHMGALEQLLWASQLRATRLCDELQTTLDASEEQHALTEKLQRSINDTRTELQRLLDLLLRANQSPELLLRANQSPELLLRANQSPELLLRANQSPELLLRANQSPELLLRANQSPDLLLRANQSPELLLRANQSPELLLRANQSPDLLLRANQSPELLLRANQSPEHRVLNPGPLKASGAQLKWAAPLAHSPAPKGPKTIRAGQSVQRKTGFDPSLDRDSRATSKRGAEDKNTKRREAPGNSSDEKRSVDESKKRRAKPQREDGEREDGEREDGEREDGEREDGEREDGEREDGEREDGERASETVAFDSIKESNISAKSPTEMKHKEPRTVQGKDQGLKTQSEAQKAVHKTESKTMSSGFAPKTNKDENKNQVDEVSGVKPANEAKTETEKVEICQKDEEIKVEVCVQNGGIEPENKVKNVERRTLLNENLKLENELEIKADEEEKVYSEKREDISTTNVSDFGVNRHEISKLETQTSQSEQDAKKTLEKTLTNESQIQVKTTQKEAELEPQKRFLNLEEKIEISPKQLCEFKDESSPSLSNENNLSPKQAESENVAETSPNVIRVDTKTFHPEIKVTVVKTIQEKVNKTNDTPQEDLTKDAVVLTSERCDRTWTDSSEAGAEGQKTVGEMTLNEEEHLSKPENIEEKRRILNRDIFKIENGFEIKAHEKVCSENGETRDVQESTNVTTFGIKRDAVETQTSQSEKDAKNAMEKTAQTLTNESQIQAKTTPKEAEPEALDPHKLVLDLEEKIEIQKQAVDAQKEESSPSLSNKQDLNSEKVKSEVKNVTETSLERMSVDAAPIRSESRLIVVKITEETQESVNKTIDKPQEDSIQDSVHLNSEGCDRNVSENEKSVREMTPNSNSVDAGKKRHESNIIIVKIIEEIQDSVRKTNANDGEDFENEEEFVLKSENCDQNAAENENRTVEILGNKQDEKSGGETANVQNNEVEIVSETSAKQIIVNSETVNSEENIKGSKTAEIPESLTKTETRENHDLTLKYCGKNTTQNHDVKVEIKQRPIEEKRRDKKESKTEIQHNEFVLKPNNVDSETKSTGNIITESKLGAEMKVCETKTELNFAETTKTDGRFDAKTRASQSDKVPEKLTTKKDQILTKNCSEIVTKITEKEKSKDATVEANIAQINQNSASQKKTLNVKNEMEISQKQVTLKRKETESKTEAENHEITAQSQPNETTIPTGLDLPVTRLDFEQNTEFLQNPRLEEEFLRLNEDTFCPQDLEEFGETGERNDAMAELDLDEDLTEAKVCVRPMERYVLKESPSFSDGFSDSEETGTMRERLGTFGDDEGDAPLGSGVGGSLQIHGAERVIAEKEREMGFGGLYRAKATRKCKERETFEEKVSRARDERNNKGKVKVEKVEEPDENFSTKDVNDWIHESVLVQRSDDSSKGGLNEEKMSENAAELDGFAEMNDVKRGQVCGDSSERVLPMDAQSERERSLTDLTHKEESFEVEKKDGEGDGSLEIPSANVSSEWRVYGRSSGRMSTSPPKNLRQSVTGKQDSSPTETHGQRNPTKGLSGLASSPLRSLSPGRFESGEWLVYGNRERIGRRASESDEFEFGNLRPTSPLDLGRFGRTGSGEWLVYGQNRDRLSRSVSDGYCGPRTMSPTSPSDPGRFGRTGSGERIVYGNDRDRMSRAERDDSPLDSRALSPIGRPPLSPRPLSPTQTQSSGMFFRSFSPPERPFSPPPLSPYGRFGKADSAEWRVYGRSSSDERLSCFGARTTSPTSPEPLRRRSLSPEAALDWRVYRSLSPRRAEAESAALDPRALSPPPAGRLGKSDGKDWLVYKNLSAKEGERLRKRALSPPEVQRKLFFVQRGDGSKGGVVRRSGSVDSAGNASGKSGRISVPGGRSLVSSFGKFVSAEWKRSRNKTKETGGSGGRVISSSGGPIRSSGSSGGAKKERISVCKMMSRSKEKKSTDSSVRLWLTSADPGARPEDSKP